MPGRRTAASALHPSGVPQLASAAFALAALATFCCAAESGGFVLVEPAQKQTYPLFGVFPLPLDLQAQALLGGTLLVAVALGALLLFRGDADTDSESLLEDVLAQLEVAWQLLLQLPQWALAEMLATASAGLGLGSDLGARIYRLTAGRRRLSAAAPGAEDVPLSQRAAKRPRGASLLRRAAPAPAAAAPSGGAAAQHLPGLYNTGNTCFFNSVLQALASSQGMQEYLEGIIALADRWDVATPVTDALHEILNVLNTPTSKPSAVYPSDLSRALSNVSLLNGTRSLVGAQQQQDAHELLVLLTSAVERELTIVQAQRRELLRLSRGGLRAALSLPHVADDPPGRGDPVPAVRGLTAQRTSCYTCGYTEAIRHHAFDELSVAVPAYACTLEHCLARWAEVEEVEWVCHACSLRRTAEHLAADVARLEGAGASDSPLAGNGHANGNGKAHGTPKTAALSASKKKRLKEARKLEARVRTVISLGLHEDEAASSGLLEGIKLARTPSPSSTKQVMVARAPRTLAIHLNRSAYYGSFGATKNNASVRFGEWLDLRPFTTNGALSTAADEPISAAGVIDGVLPSQAQQAQAQLANERLQLLYRLQAVVVHLGGHHYGHYIAFRRRPPRGGGGAPDAQPGGSGGAGGGGGARLPWTADDSTSSEWLRISDESARPCSLDDVLSQHAFLLFYERAQVPAPAPASGPASATATASASAPTSAPTSAPQEASDGHAPLRGFENLQLDREQRLRRLLQPRAVPRWSVEPGAEHEQDTGPERERADAAAPAGAEEDKAQA